MRWPRIIAAPLLVCLVSTAAFPQTTGEQWDFLRNPEYPFKATYIKYYPDKPDVPAEFVDIHIQKDGYVYTKHQAKTSERPPKWIASDQRDMVVRYRDTHWRYKAEVNELTYYDPATIGMEVRVNNPVLNADYIAMLEINNLLHWGVTYVDGESWTISANGDIYADNDVKVSGGFLKDGMPVGGGSLPDKAQLHIIKRRDDMTAPQHFNWTLEYEWDVPPKVVPREIIYTFVHESAKPQLLNALYVLEASSGDAVSAYAQKDFTPDALVGHELNYYYMVQADGALAFTNSVGELAVKQTSGKLDEYFERRRIVRRIFLPSAIIIVATVVWVFHRKR